MTEKDKIQEYVNLIEAKEEIVSCIEGHLNDLLNTEINLGTVNSLQEAKE